MLIAAFVLLFFALIGSDLLRTLGIGLDAFRIAGGIMLFLTALDMVFERGRQRREPPDAAADISVYPMAIPLIAGPGSIASAMLLTGQARGAAETMAVLGALALVLAMLLAALILAGPIMQAIGTRIEAMITRILGVLLAALAVQFVLDGVKAGLG